MVIRNTPKCRVPLLMSLRSYRTVRYRYWCRTKLFPRVRYGANFLPYLSKCLVLELLSYRSYRSARYRYWSRSKRSQAYGNGIDVLPTLSKCPVPELLPYPTKHPEVFCTGVDVGPNFPKGAVTVLMFSRSYRNVRYRNYLSYRRCRSVRYRNYCHTQPNIPGLAVPVSMSDRIFPRVR